MYPTFTFAIVRKPGENFRDGLTTVDLGAPDYDMALAQHGDYCDALKKCGLKLTVLEADRRYPDGTFVDDTAVVTDECLVQSSFTFPSRQGEEETISNVLPKRRTAEVIQKPATLEGGDILRVGKHFFIGLSKRTNDKGAKKLGNILANHGYAWSTLPVTKVLHLSTGATWIGGNNVVATSELAEHLKKHDWLNVIAVPEDERYAANCLYINGTIIMPAGFPKTKSLIQKVASADIVEVEMSEFEKMDGGLTCLSLRF